MRSKLLLPILVLATIAGLALFIPFIVPLSASVAAAVDERTLMTV